MSKLTLDDKPKQPQVGPSTTGPAQQQKPPQGGQQGSARGQGQQQQPPPGAGPSTSGQAQQQKPPQGGQQGSAHGQGQQKQQKPPQGQQGSARGQGQQQPQKAQQSGPQGSARGPGYQQQQKPPQSAQPPAADSAWGKSKPQGQGAPPQQQPQATTWTQRPIQPSTQAAGSSGQKPQQRPAQGARSAQGKGDQKAQAPKPAIIPYDYKICEYKGSGTRGKKVQIETNYLKLDVTKLVNCAYHYDVTIDFEPAGRSLPGKKFMHPVFAAFVAKNFPRASLAYDGQKNAYAPQKLDLTKPYERVVTIVDGETAQQRSFKVEIQEVRGSLIDLSVLRK